MFLDQTVDKVGAVALTISKSHNTHRRHTHIF